MFSFFSSSHFFIVSFFTGSFFHFFSQNTSGSFFVFFFPFFCLFFCLSFFLRLWCPCFLEEGNESVGALPVIFFCHFSQGPPLHQTAQKCRVFFFFPFPPQTFFLLTLGGSARGIVAPVQSHVQIGHSHEPWAHNILFFSPSLLNFGRFFALLERRGLNMHFWAFWPIM